MSSRLEQILEAGARLLERDGLRAVTVRAVAKEAGIGASTLRHYFPSQQALHGELLRGRICAHLSDLRINDSSVPPSVRLSECLAQFLPSGRDQISASADAWLVRLQRISGDQMTSGVLEHFRGMGTEAQTTVERWLGVLAAEGAPLAASKTKLAELLGTVCNGLLQELIFDPEVRISDARRRLDDAVALVLRPRD